MAMHGSALPDGSYGGKPAGLLLTTPDGRKIYMAGDTGLFGDMALIGEEGIDLAMLPIGDNYTMGPADALRAVKLLQPGHVIPIHYNTFGLIQQDATAWKVMVEKKPPLPCTYSNREIVTYWNNIFLGRTTIQFNQGGSCASCFRTIRSGFVSTGRDPVGHIPGFLAHLDSDG